MFSLFMHHFAAVAEPMIPAEEPDITKIDSIEDGFGFFRTLGHNSAEWFQREQQNLFAMAIGIGVTLVTVFLVRWFFRAVLLRITRKLPSELPTHIVEQLGAPVTFLLLLIGLSTCNNMVHFPGSIDEWLSKGFYACFILAFLWGIFRIIAVVDIHVLQKRLNEDHKLNKLLSDLIRRSVKAAVWTMAVIFIAQNLFNLNVTALITGAGVAGLAIAFAAQNTIANLFGAMSLISDRTFKVGDRIICNSPNRILSDSTVENITERNSIKYAFTLGLVYSTTPEQMRRALRILGGILDNHPGFDPATKPPLYFFTDYKAFSLDISVTLWFQTLDFVQFQKWKQEINLAILEQFNAAGLEFAFPTSTNYIIAQNNTAQTSEGAVVK